MKWMKIQAVTPNSCWSACRVLEQLYVNHFIGFHQMKPFIFCMDNAGGHGTNDAKRQYIEIPKAFKVEVIWQAPKIPETNMLDLGVCMSIQSAVMKVDYGRRCHHDALAKSVEDAWNGYLSQEAFYNVLKRLRVVLSCIVEDNGGNRLVELKREKLFRDATIIDLTDEDDQNDTIQPEILEVDLEEDNLSVTSL
jgi:hypothetical protein